MIHNNFPLLRKFTTPLSIIFIGMLLLFGCGGGGGGGAQQTIVPENKIPTASITSPTGTQFNEGENIAFDGNATDEEDGALDGDALVWTSNIDGIIGTGTAVTTSALTAGDHEITLTATDSDDGVHTTDPTLISIAQTRFIKMGTETKGVPDASNAFDGDHETAATIMTPDTEFIHFKALIGGVDTFLFKIKLGASTPGSMLAVQGLNSGDTSWRPVSDVTLEADQIATVKVTGAQDYKDEQGYINLRVRWEGGGSEENATIYELWRTDPAYAGNQTIGTNGIELAFDGNPATGAIIATDWDGSAPFLHFKAYVGNGRAESFACNIAHNKIGPAQSLVIEIEDPSAPSAGNWSHVESFSLNEASTRTFTIENVQDYLDADRYVSLRAFWVGFGDGNQMEIYEISRIDPVLIGQKTTLDGIQNPESAIDGNDTSFATINYFWGEPDDHYDFLHIQTYAGDASVFTIKIIASPNDFGSSSRLILEGETESDKWSVIESIVLDIYETTTIKLSNARDYVDANGYLNLRVLWQSDSLIHDALIYEISRETN